jgi:hypothetical protein
MSPEGAPHDGNDPLSAVFHRALPPAALVGIAALLLAGTWGAVAPPAAGVPVFPVVVFGAIALAAAVVSLARRRSPATPLSIAAHLLALHGSAVVFGALRGSVPGALAGAAGLVFFVLAVVSTLLWADGAGARSRSRFD